MNASVLPAHSVKLPQDRAPRTGGWLPGSAEALSSTSGQQACQNSSRTNRLQAEARSHSRQSIDGFISLSFQIQLRMNDGARGPAQARIWHWGLLTAGSVKWRSHYGASLQISSLHHRKLAAPVYVSLAFFWDRPFRHAVTRHRFLQSCCLCAALSLSTTCVLL